MSDAAGAGTGAAAEVEETGPFRIYLGAAPGVGKTYGMLSEAHRRRGRGADVVAGFVESYGRPRTEQLVNGLEVIPRTVVEYRGSRLEEMDLDAILRRRPDIALVDELAHTNVPGSGRNEKRWQDRRGRSGPGHSQLRAGARDNPDHDRVHPAQLVAHRRRRQIVRRVIHEADALGIDVHLIARHEQPPDQAPEPSATRES